MTDIRQTMWNIERCLCHVPDSCSDCSHHCDRESFPDCMEKLLDDAYQLLKARQPRVMTLEEVKALQRDSVVWYEHTGCNTPRPRVIGYVADEYVAFTDGGKWRFDADRYGASWRCWTSRPTDEQREAEPWE